VSEQVFDIFHDVTPLVEGLSLDEAFLDVTGSIRLFGEPEEIAATIRSRVRSEVGLPCSIGIAPSKFIAKLASKAAKPIADRDGVREGLGVLRIEPGKELDFILPLPVKAVWGVGPATLERLLGVGIHTVGDLAAVDLDVLEGIVGVAHARHLHDLAHARDDRDVVAQREAKSIGNEETFSVDLTTHEEVRAQVVRLADNVAHRCRTEGQLPLTITLKIKYADFEVVTRSKTSSFAVTSAQAMVHLLDDALAEIAVARGVRLVGISARNFGEATPQLSLFDDAAVTEGVESAWAPTAEAIDEIRAKFGHSSIGPASALRGGRRPGSSPWGPNSSPRDV
jgi:DNA polymerase-4